MRGFGIKLTNWRLENNYTQEKFASIMNVSTRMIQYWEGEKCFPCIENLIFLSDIMNVSLDYLCGRTTIWQTSELILHSLSTVAHHS